MKILFVEDDKDIWLLYERDLEELGITAETLWAVSVNQGLALIRQNPDIGIISVDGSLNGEDGVELIKAIRSSFSGKIIAASHSGESIREMLEAGADVECKRNKHLVCPLIKEILESS